MEALNNNFSHLSIRELCEIKWPHRDHLPELNPKYEVCFWCWLSPWYPEQMLLAPSSQMLTEQDFTSFGQGFQLLFKSLWGQFLPPKQGQRGNKFLCLWNWLFLGLKYNCRTLPPRVPWDLLRRSAAWASPSPAVSALKHTASHYLAFNSCSFRRCNCRTNG